VLTSWQKRSDLFKQLNLSNQTINREKYLDPLIDLGWVAMEFPDKKTSPKQRYKTTELGQRLLTLLKK
jgi:ATP-dependent DNA helicase RecG